MLLAEVFIDFICSVFVKISGGNKLHVNKRKEDKNQTSLRRYQSKVVKEPMNSLII
jgi:hypothetical protein